MRKNSAKFMPHVCVPVCEQKKKESPHAKRERGRLTELTRRIELFFLLLTSCRSAGVTLLRAREVDGYTCVSGKGLTMLYCSMYAAGVSRCAQ